MFKLYNKIIFFGTVGFRTGTRVLFEDFGRVSVACPGHGSLQHVYGVTITCSSLFLHLRNILKSSFESRTVLLDVIYLVSLVLTQSISRICPGCLKRVRRRGTGVLLNVFFGVILSVFKRSVACPGHGLLQHVYGVTITCSSWFHIKKGHRDVLLQVQNGRLAMLLLDAVHLVSSSSPKVFHESALGAFSVSAIVCLSWTTHFACLWCHDPWLPSFAYIGSFVFCRKGERFNELLLDRVLGMDRVGARKALDPFNSASLPVKALTGAILLMCLTAHTPRGDVKRGFDLVLDTMVNDASLSCVRNLPRLKHIEPLSHLLYRLSCMSSNVFAPIFETLFKSSGQMGRCGPVVCSMEEAERSWVAALSCNFRFHGQRPGNKRAARRSLEADLQPAYSEEVAVLHQHRVLHHRSLRLRPGRT